VLLHRDRLPNYVVGNPYKTLRRFTGFFRFIFPFFRFAQEFHKQPGKRVKGHRKRNPLKAEAGYARHTMMQPIASCMKKKNRRKCGEIRSACGRQPAGTGSLCLPRQSGHLCGG